MLRNFRKPLVVVAPKVLLRLPAAASSLSDMGPGTSFTPVLPGPCVRPDKVTRIVFCTGKHYYNIQKELETRKIDNTVVIRLEVSIVFMVFGRNLAVILRSSVKILSSGFWTKSDTNWPAQTRKKYR